MTNQITVYTFTQNGSDALCAFCAQTIDTTGQLDWVQWFNNYLVNECDEPADLAYSEAELTAGFGRFAVTVTHYTL